MMKILPAGVLACVTLFLAGCGSSPVAGLSCAEKVQYAEQQIAQNGTYGRDPFMCTNDLPPGRLEINGNVALIGNRDAADPRVYFAIGPHAFVGSKQQADEYLNRMVAGRTLLLFARSGYSKIYYVRYYDPDGTMLTWVSDDRDVHSGKWHASGTKLCQSMTWRSGRNSGKTNETCEYAVQFLSGTKSARDGDIFNLASGQAPFTFWRGSVPRGF